MPMLELTLDTLKNEKNSLIRKLEAIDRVIEEYKVNKDKNISYASDRNGNYKAVFDSKTNKEKPLDGFPIQATWLNQILYLLNSKDRFMSNHELAEALTDYHFGFNVDKMKRKVSVVISAAYKTNRITGLIKIGTTKSAKDALWGFDKWITSDKNIKKENLPFGIIIQEKITLG